MMEVVKEEEEEQVVVVVEEEELKEEVQEVEMEEMEKEEQPCGKGGHCGPSRPNPTSHHMLSINIRPKKAKMT